MFIPRPFLEKRIYKALEYNPAVVLLGPRQCGKTTIARKIADTEQAEYFDLENPLDIARLSAPMLALGGITGLVVIDEAQRKWKISIFGLPMEERSLTFYCFTGENALA